MAKVQRIYTRTGDRGETGLIGGQRVPKDAARIEAFGCLDELNSALGLAAVEIAAAGGSGAGATRDLAELRGDLGWVQNRLFDLGATLATPPGTETGSAPALAAADVERLERTMDRWNESLPRLTAFILPGGGRAGASLHAARSVCRRAEREVLRLHRESPVDEVGIVFLNRLSDFLFVAARRAAALTGAEETVWEPGSGQ